MFDYANYRKQVLQTYKKKRDAKALSSRLTHPTPASLKSECMAVCNDRFLQKDEKVLSTFFGAKDNQRTYIQAIKQFDRDKFKPLQKFLRGLTFETHPTNIELLAWLIDFESRPFDPTKTYSDNEPVEQNKEIVIKQEDDDTTAEKETVKDGGDINEEEGTISGLTIPIRDPKLHTRKRFFFIGGGIILVLILSTVYWLTNNNKPFGAMFEAGSCMYWVGDHYQPIPCTEKIDDKLIIALDTVKVRNFKKITRPDTITAKAIGSVWYSKIDNQIEFFTSAGYHPTEMQHHLKPLTAYIINKYIHSK